MIDDFNLFEVGKDSERLYCAFLVLLYDEATKHRSLIGFELEFGKALTLEILFLKIRLG